MLNSSALKIQTGEISNTQPSRPELRVAATGANGLADNQKAKLNECIQFVDQLLAGYNLSQLPETAREILGYPWKKLLVVLMLREGITSTKWKDAVAVADMLANCTKGASTPSERYQIISSLPKLRSRLQEGFAYISFCANTSARLLNELQTCCIKSMRTQ